MRKICILFVFLIIANSELRAQVTFNPGIQAGLNVSRISGSELSSRTGYFFGAFGAIKFSKAYTLQPEVTYSQQGGKGNYTIFYPGYDDYITDNADVSLNYLSISINNKITLYNKLYLMLGEFTDFVVGDNIKQDSSTLISKGQDIDYGVFGGLGYNFPKGFGIEVRAKKGFGDALDYNFSGDTTKMYNVVFSVGATYTFEMK